MAFNSSRFLEIIDQHGHRPPIGWPIEFTDHSEFHTSPFVYDIDQDGVDEFGSSNNDGIIRFIRMADGIHLSKYDIKEDCKEEQHKLEQKKTEIN